MLKLLNTSLERMDLQLCELKASNEMRDCK